MTAVGTAFVDIPIAPDQALPVRFKMYWTESQRWKGLDFLVRIAD
jgi:hypothetical protein